MKHLSEPTLQWFDSYEIRTGGDGKVGVYLRDYNVRLATFNANTTQLQTRLKLLFERANAKPRAEAIARAAEDQGVGITHHEAVNAAPRKARKTDKRQNPTARAIRRHPKRKRNEAWGPGSGTW